MANTTLTRTFGTPSSTKTGTFSFWLKNLSSAGGGVFNNYGDANNRAILYISNSQIDYFDAATSTSISGTPQYRDPNGWYHVVLRIDTTQSSANDRTRVYVNGALQEATYGHTYNLNENSYMFTAGTPFVIGRDNSSGGSGDHLNAVISHFHYCDGQSYAPTVFGSVDSVTGEWQINTAPSMTMGNQGFTILKDGNTITDQSANSNNFSLGSGTLTKTEDNPSNVFATMNPLSKSLTNVVLSKGNTIVRNDANANGNVLGTIALGNGKYYWETYRHGGGNTGLGITLASVDGSNHTAVHASKVQYYQDGYIYQTGLGLSNINTGVTYGDTDIIGVSVDTENGTIKFYKNGALVNNSSQTNSVFTLAQNELIPFWYVENGGELRSNFGNGYFGTTAVSSAGTNASGNGIFEYNVQPTDATAISTKGLNL